MIKELENLTIPTVAAVADKFGGKKDKLLEDVNVLIQTASQTSFIYTLAFHLWKKVSEVRGGGGQDSSSHT